MVLSTAVSSFGADSYTASEETKYSLPGFSYEIHGENVDNTDKFNADLAYERINENSLKIKIPVIPGVTGETINTVLISSSENLYTGILRDGININLEFLENGNPILDIIKGDRVYAFGHNRRAIIENYIESLQDEESTTGFTPQPKYAGGMVKTASNGKVYLKAVWNPTKSNRLAIRVNTQGSQVGTTVQSISIKNGKVPKSYVVKSLNPTGANNSADFANSLSYIINSVVYLVNLPSFSSAPKSSCNGSAFTFDVSGIGASWNSLNKTSDSTAGVNGMMFYVFLDANLSVKPAPTGTVNIRYRVVATGSFDATLAF